MTPEIKERIKTVQTGHVPDGYKRSKIGIIPEEWLVVRFDKITEKTGRKKLENEDLPAYSINNQIGFCSQSEQFEKDGYSNTCKDGYTVVSKGAFAYNPARINVGSIGLLKDKPQVMISSLYVCFKMSPECDSPFFEYYFKSHRFNYDVNAYTEGSVREYLFYDNFSKISVALPPLPEQQKIAEILSTQDKIIELKEKLLEQKQEQKKYLVKKIMFASDEHNAVLADIIDLISIRSCASQNCYVSTENMISNYGGIIFSEEGQIVEGIAFRKDDILVGNIRPYLKKVWRASIDGVCSADVLVFRAKKAIPLYLYYLVANDTFCEYVMNGVKGTKMPRGDKKQILQMPLFIPPISEQQAIAEVLSTADKEIDLLKSEIEQEKLKKKSLMQLLLTGIVRVKV